MSTGINETIYKSPGFKTHSVEALTYPLVNVADSTTIWVVNSGPPGFGCQLKMHKTRQQTVKTDKCLPGLSTKNELTYELTQCDDNNWGLSSALG